MGDVRTVKKWVFCSVAVDKLVATRSLIGSQEVVSALGDTMKFWSFVTLLGLAPFASLLAASCIAGSEDVELHEVVADTKMVEKAFDFFSVTHDGTLSLKPEAREWIPEEQRDDAMLTLERLNNGIRAGEVNPFVPGDERLNDEVVGRGNALLDICYCADAPKCCKALLQMCCKSGVWLFCWEYGSC